MLRNGYLFYIISRLRPRHSLYAAHGTQFLQQGFEARGVVDHHRENAREEAVVGVDVDAAEHDVLFF